MNKLNERIKELENELEKEKIEKGGWNNQERVLVLQTELKGILFVQVEIIKMIDKWRLLSWQEFSKPYLIDLLIKKIKGDD